MSWSYCVEIDITLASAALAAIEKQRPDDVVLPPRWSGLREAGLEAALGRPLHTTDTFAKTLGWFSGKHVFLPAVQRREVVGDRTHLRVLTSLDKSQLDHAFPLVALFHTARDAGATGTLRLIDDGTGGGIGVELTLAAGSIVRRALEEDWDTVSRMGADLASERAKPPAAKPATRSATKPAKTRAAKPATKPAKARAAKPVTKSAKTPAAKPARKTKPSR